MKDRLAAVPIFCADPARLLHSTLLALLDHESSAHRHNAKLDCSAQRSICGERASILASLALTQTRYCCAPNEVHEQLPPRFSCSPPTTSELICSSDSYRKEAFAENVRAAASFHAERDCSVAA